MREKLWPVGVHGSSGNIPENEQPTLEAFVLPPDKAPRAAIIVCPGGGYSMVCDTYEGVDVARFFNQHGISAFVLRYRVGKNARHPAPLEDATRGMQIVRSRASEYGIDPKRIGITGFSAGGHLTASLAAHFKAGNPNAADPLERVSSRPDFAMPIYAVISMQPGMHEGCKANLLGSNPDPALVDQMSIERSLPDDAPPFFLVHTSEDETVPPEHSVWMYQALRKRNIPAELHIFEKGVHGLGLGGGAKSDPDGARGMYQWPELCVNWLRERGMLE